MNNCIECEALLIDYDNDDFENHLCAFCRDEILDVDNYLPLDFHDRYQKDIYNE